MKSIRILLVALMLTGCATVYPPAPTPICSAPEYQGCLVCELLQKANLTAEQADTMLLDATLVGVGFKLINGPDARAAIEKLKLYINSDPTVTMAKIFDRIQVDPILMILASRHLKQMQAFPQLNLIALDQPSRKLIGIHLDHQLQQLSIF